MDNSYVEKIGGHALQARAIITKKDPGNLINLGYDTSAKYT